MAWNYSAKPEQPHAKAVMTSLAFSTKHAIEIAHYIRGRSVKQARMLLENVVKERQAVPFKRYYRNMGHKVGIAAGQYPVKAAGYFLELLASAESNAEAKGLSLQDLYIAHLVSKQGSRNWKGGRLGRRKNKCTHIEVVLMEGVPKKGAWKVTKKETKTHKSKTTVSGAAGATPSAKGEHKPATEHKTAAPKTAESKTTEHKGASR